MRKILHKDTKRLWAICYIDCSGKYRPYLDTLDTNIEDCWRKIFPLANNSELRVLIEKNRDKDLFCMSMSLNFRTVKGR